MLGASYFARMKTQLWLTEFGLHMDKITLPPATDKHLPEKGFFIWFVCKEQRQKIVKFLFEDLRSSKLSSKNEEIEVSLLPFATEAVL